MDTIKTIESQQTFAKSVYLDFMSKRFGITQKGITDLSSAIVQKYLCDWQNNEKNVPAILDVSYDTYTPLNTSDPCSGVGVPTWCILCADGNCNDEECLIVNVVDSAGNPVKNFEIYIDGFNSGFTDENGEFLYTFEKASVETQHTIQVCYCFETVGNCRQQKITIVVEADECAEECKPLTPCIEIKKKIIDEFACNAGIYFNDVLTYTQQCNVDLNLVIQNQDGDLIDATFNGYDIIITQLCFAGVTLMKTGQTTSYRTGDDGDIEAGRDVDFFTLPSNNPFGNTNRFTDELGGQTYTNDIVIDWSTYDGSDVLGYSRVSLGLFNWANCIDNCLSYSVGTFTSGWRLLNVNELWNIVRQDNSQLLDYAPFNLTSTSLWTSTHRDEKQVYKFGSADLNPLVASPFLLDELNAFPIRNFIVTGTTLT
jgi:hypothetical protein